jgi:hypothetical protein
MIVTVEIKTIESAPRDGSEIMGYNSDAARVISWRHGGWGEVAWFIIDSEGGACDEAVQFTPTHWSPVPKLPATPTPSA